MHVQYVWPNIGTHKMGPTRQTDDVGQQAARDIFWPVKAFLWFAATFKNLLGSSVSR